MDFTLAYEAGETYAAPTRAHTDRDIVQLIQLVNQGTDDGNIQPEIPQLLKRQVVLDD